MEKRALLAVLLSTAVFMIYMYVFAPQPQQKTPTTDKAQTETKAETKPQTQGPAQPGRDKAPPKAAAAPKPTPSLGPARKVTVDNGLVKLVFSERGGRLVSAKLLKFKEHKADDAPLKELVRLKDPALAPLGLTTSKGGVPGLETAVFKLVDQQEDVVSAVDKEVVLTFRWVSAEGMEVIKCYTVKPNSYLFGLRVELINHTGRTLDDNLALNLTAANEPHEGGRYAFRGFGAYVNEKLTETAPDDLTEPKVINGKVSWGGYENSYFLQAIVPEAARGSVKGSLISAAKGKEVLEIRYTSLPFSLAPSASQEFVFDLYFGPKDIDVLSKVGHDLNKSINMGFFDIVAKPLLYFLKWAYDLVGNYGVAIIIMTICVKLLFFPLAQKSYKSMKNMQKLQPQMVKLREKYKNDKQRLNQEMMSLYKAHKVNPMGGCLPMIIQIPVFFALYRLLDYAIELRHAPFILWIQDLSAPDRLFRFPFSIPLMEPPYGIPVLTILMGASMFITQKMTPTPGDPTQAKIMLLMPIIFTFIFINFPAGLVLYWLVQNVLSIGQQYYVNKRP